jgi:hypothetical protein
MKSNSIKNIILVILLLFLWQTGFSQGFVNLNFESAQIIPIPDGDFGPETIATSNAVPGWTVYYGFSGTSQQQTEMTYNDFALGSTFVTLFATNGQQIAGNFSVYLQGGSTAPAASISQTGLVPVGSQSLLFDAQPGVPSLLTVSLGGQNISFNAISNGPNYTLYGGDISAFAGQTEQLMFSALEENGNDWNIDNIQFSTSPVPEPSELALGALGALLLGFRCWKRSLQ